MDKRDLELGMDSNITRRDFIDGAALTVAGLTAASTIGVAAISPAEAAPAAVGEFYPPMRQGMRGFDPKAIEAGHAIRDHKAFGEGTDTGEVYDLVVVGAGMSGLGAAYFYRKEIPNAKILILEGCDDFGGTARRNEFNVDGKQLLTNGGAILLQYPNTFPPACKELLRDVGIDLERGYSYPNNEPLVGRPLGLKSAIYLAKEIHGGADRFVFDPVLGGVFLASLDELLPPPDRQELADFLAKMPYSEATKTGLVKFYTETVDYMPGLPVAEKIKQLRKMSYTDFLANVVKVHPDVVDYFIRVGGVWSNKGHSPDTISAWYAFRRGAPGFRGMGLPYASQTSNLTKDPGKHLGFPDGNHGVARLIVRWLIPDALPGTTMEDSIGARLDYAKLDLPKNDVRLRLSSTCMRVKHLGDPMTAKVVEVTYLLDGKPYRVRSRAAVLAGFNAMIPHMVPDLPETQKAGLRWSVRDVVCFMSVALHNWRAFHKLGASSISCPGLSIGSFGLKSAPEWGGAYKNPTSPDEPIIASASYSYKSLVKVDPSLPPRDRVNAERAALLSVSFETMERALRSQLDRVLGPYGFSSKRDIAGIIVNRFGHGLVHGANSLYDPDWSHRTDAPWIVGRQRFGRIAISCTDSAATPLAQAGWAQSHRAVNELIMNVVRPVYDFKYSESDSAGEPGDEPNNF